MGLCKGRSAFAFKSSSPLHPRPPSIRKCEESVEVEVDKQASKDQDTDHSKREREKKRGAMAEMKTNSNQIKLERNHQKKGLDNPNIT